MGDPPYEEGRTAKVDFPSLREYASRPMLHRAVVLVAFVALACAAAPGATRMPTIAPGVIVGGVYLGDLTSEPAREQLAAGFDRPIPVVRGGQRWLASPQRLGAGAAIDTAVAKALAAAPGEEIGVDVRWSAKKVGRFVDRIARRVDRAAVDAQLESVSSAGPVISEAKTGVAVRRGLLQRRLERALEHSLRTRIAVPTRPVEAERTRARFGPVIWIARGSNTLRLYNGRRFVQSFGVATGRSQYPTPSGLWAIVDMQRNPWWRPPDSPWAQGLEPIPPGPGNPLGTRWMGLNAAGVGIHGTPDAASIGYSASHGCIRMQIANAEWLFKHVTIGTPVYIT
jgi:lipoprotein-anchoring transpeptidase ErfK/SrfK